MTDVRQNFAVRSGDTATVQFTLFNASGDPLNLSGITLEWRMSRNYETEAFLIKTSDDITEIEVTDALGGIAQVYLAPLDTEDLFPTVYIHDLSGTDVLGNIETLAVGSITIEPAIQIIEVPPP